MEELKGKMEREFGEAAAKEKFKVVKVNVSTRPNELEIEYMYDDEMIPKKGGQNTLDIPLSFRVSVKQY